MPARPWPGVTDDEVALAGYGLGDHERPRGWLQGPAWPWLRDTCRRRQILPYLQQAVADGARELTDEEQADLRQTVVDELAAALLLERALWRATAILEAEGAAFRVLKGPANAHLDHPHPAQRTFGDLDLLVAAPDLELAKAALEARGYRRAQPERHAGFDARFGKSLTLVDPTGVELDVHRTFLSGPFGHCFDPATLFAAPEWFDLAGRRIPALSRVDRLVHACVSATVSDPRPRLRPARDVVQLLVHDELDADAVPRRAARLGLGIVVARAITLCVGGLQVDGALAGHPLVRWAERYTPGRRELAQWACYGADASSYVRKAWGSLRTVPGVRDRAGYAAAMLRPDPDAVAAPLANRLRRGVTLLPGPLGDRAGRRHRAAPS
jgi:hypothetical protein